MQAVELVLTTGPLSRERGGASPAAAVAPSGERAGLAAEAAGGGYGGTLTFEGFGQNVQASVVEAVAGLLGEATAAAERWGLSPQERGRLQAWSRAARGGGEATSSAC